MLCVIFPLLLLKFFCQFNNCVSWGVPPWVHPAWDSLLFLDLVDYFLSPLREVFSYSNIFSSPFSLLLLRPL